MPYCPNCSTEYVDGTVTCSDCDVALVAERPPKQDSADETHESGDFVLLRTYSTRVNAEMVGDALENEGITGLIKSNEVFGMGTGLGVMAPARIEVWVTKGDIEIAADIADNTIDPI
jgi:hypothetical protein